jgi:acyl dehydratase
VPDTRYFEDMHVGDRFEGQPRTITSADVREFAELTGDRNPIHLDPEFARTTPFGRPIAHGMLTLSVALGLWSAAGITRDSLVALVSLEEVKFRQPLYPGERVHLSTEVLSVRPSRSHPGGGIVTYTDRLLDDQQGVVVEFRRVVLLKKRSPFTGAEPPSGATAENGN